MAGDPPRLRRGLILLVLYEQYPSHLAISILERQMEPAYGPEEPQRELVRDMAYLEDSGLIERSTAKFGPRTLESVKILPAGIALVEHVTEDPGVEIA